MADLEKATGSLKKNPLITVTFGLLLLTNLLNTLAFSTTAWGRIYSVSGGGFYGVGLWRVCSSGITAFFVDRLCTDTTGWSQDWYAAAQFFTIVGFVGITGGLVLLLLYMCAKSWKGNPSLLFWTAVFILVTAILYLIGLIIFGVDFFNRYQTFIRNSGNTVDLSWSFAVAVTADVFAIIVGILLLYQSRKTRSTSPNKGNAFKSSNNPNNKDRSPREKKKSVSHENKNQNANKKSQPVVTKTSTDHPPAKENEKQRKTSNHVQPNHNGPHKQKTPGNEDKGHDQTQQKKNVQPNLNAGPVEVQKAPISSTVIIA